MENGIHSQEKSYWSREVAELLGISDSTLRKYCLLLEQNGYIFLRDEQNRRAFIERDLTALRRFQEMAKNSDMTLEDAASGVVSAMAEDERAAALPALAPESSATASPSPYTQRYDEMSGKMQQLIEHNQKQEAFNRFLLDRIEKQEAFIEKLLKETQLQLSATREEEFLQERQKRITNMITQRRVEARLETEAIELWYQKPKSVRMKKVGFFRKEEDWERKERFIRVYINNHFEERLKDEVKQDNVNIGS